MSRNNYPTDWSSSTMKALTQRFLNGGTPSTHIKEYWDGKIPWITGADAEHRITTTSRKTVTELGVKRSSTNIVPKGNILLVTRTGVGKVSIAGVDVAISQDLTGIIPRTDLVDVPYLYYQLIRIISDSKNLTQGSIIQGIKREEVEKIEIPLPKLTEQRTIAHVLSTLDETIVLSESLVRKYQLIRVGFMFDLLTRGVDENGELRNFNPGKYKPSEFGDIPKEWDIATCSSVCSEIVVGIVIRPAQYYVSEGIPALRSKNIKPNGIDGSDLVFISEKSNELLTKSMVRIGNVVTVRTGEPGISCVIPDEYDGVNCIDLIISRPKPIIDPTFLALWINSPFGRNQVLQGQGGLAQQHFNVGDLKKLKIALPPLDEQKRITTLLSSQEALIEQEQSFAEKLILLKQGLMQDLLSGQVRVSGLM